MALQQKIRASVDKAFSSLGDLTQTAFLTREAVTGFDFAASEVNSSYEELQVEVVFLDSTTLEDSTVESYFLVKDTDFDLSKYSFFSIDNETYTVHKVKKSIGLIELWVRSR